MFLLILLITRLGRPSLGLDENSRHYSAPASIPVGIGGINVASAQDPTPRASTTALARLSSRRIQHHRDSTWNQSYSDVASTTHSRFSTGNLSLKRQEDASNVERDPGILTPSHDLGEVTHGGEYMPRIEADTWSSARPGSSVSKIFIRRHSRINAHLLNSSQQLVPVTCGDGTCVRPWEHEGYPDSSIGCARDCGLVASARLRPLLVELAASPNKEYLAYWNLCLRRNARVAAFQLDECW